MKLFSSRFFAAMALQLGQRLRFGQRRGQRHRRGARDARGTMASISARREAAPMTDSMCCSSAASMPMWRATNSAAFSSSAQRLVGGHQHGAFSVDQAVHGSGGS